MLTLLMQLVDHLEDTTLRGNSYSFNKIARSSDHRAQRWETKRYENGKRFHTRATLNLPFRGIVALNNELPERYRRMLQIHTDVNLVSCEATPANRSKTKRRAHTGLLQLYTVACE